MLDQNKKVHVYLKTKQKNTLDVGYYFNTTDELHLAIWKLIVLQSISNVICVNDINLKLPKGCVMQMSDHELYSNRLTQLNFHSDQTIFYGFATAMLSPFSSFITASAAFSFDKN